VARVLVKTVENRKKASAPYVPQSAVRDSDSFNNFSCTTPNSLPDLIPIHSDQECSQDFGPYEPEFPILVHENGKPYNTNIQYTHSWVDKTLITRDEWSSSSLDSSSTQCDAGR
jgi:hypothetical protein